MKLRPVNLGRVARARFVERPNRFLVRCRVRGRGVVAAHLPNPGRLQELLLPGVRLYVTPNRTGTASARKTRYTVVAVERDGVPVFLHTHATNQVARCLLERGLIPGLEDAAVVRAEVPVGRSRFDFLLREKGRDVYCEVKSVTLFHDGVAMFPDAVTARGRRHLIELAEMRGRGIRTAVILLVHSPSALWFMPDYHTDLEFSRTFLEVGRKVRIIPVALNWNRDFTLSSEVRRLRVPWKHLAVEVADRGAYLLVMELRRPRRIEVGRLGRVRFEKGFYMYAGSAMKNLTARINRHRRVRKKKHWHIDHLRAEAVGLSAFPVRSSRREECELARAVAELFPFGPDGFGSSDCACRGHLFHSRENPIQLQGFQEMLLRFRVSGIPQRSA